MVKNLPANVGDIGDTALIPGLRRSPGGGHGNPLQYSYLENPMDRGDWCAGVHGVTKSRTCLSTHADRPLPRMLFPSSVMGQLPLIYPGCGQM